MFESILVRRTNPVDFADTVDIGRLAEAMVFYQTVRLGLTRANLHQFVIGLGPELAIELVSNGAVDAVYIDRDFTVLNENQGTANESHRPATIRVRNSDAAGRALELQTRHELVQEVFAKAYDNNKPRKARHKANRFLNELREHTVSLQPQSLADTDWQHKDFMCEAVRRILADLTPSYTPPADLRITLVDNGDGSYRFDSNLNWDELHAARKAHTKAPSDLTPGSLLLLIVDMNADLYLGAALDSTISQDRLGADLMRLKCADLRTTSDLQQLQIDRFQDLVVHGVTDIAGVINSGGRTFEEFMKVQGKAKPFRAWLDGQQPDSDLVKAYSAEIEKRLDLFDTPLGKLLWVLPIAGDSVASAIDPAAAAHLSDGLVAYGLFEHFILERYLKGWRPGSFIDQRLRPFVNH